MITMNNFVGDELSNKVRVLSAALLNAESIIRVLESENQNLKDLLEAIDHNSDQEYVMCNE